MKTTTLAAAIALLPLLASSSALLACGDDPSTPAESTPDAGPVTPPTDPPAPDEVASFTLAAEPTAVEAAYGSKASVKISVARTGGVGDVALRLKDPPPGIDAVFSPASLSSNENESTLTLAIGDEAPLGASTLTVVGSSGETESSVALALTVKTITVSGKITLGTSDVTVVLVDGARVSTTSTTSGGAFTFDDVKPPYDLYSVQHTDFAYALVTDHVAYYEGLTRSDPTIEAPRMAGAFVELPEYKGTITGTLSGTATTLSGQAPLVVFWTGSSDVALKASGGMSYTFEPSWRGMSVGKPTGTVHALQFDNGLDDGRGAWRGYASGAVALGAGESATVNLAMTTPVNATIAGAITPPSGFPAPLYKVGFQVGSKEYAPFTGGSMPSPFQFAIPVVAGMTSSLEASSELGDARSEVRFSGLAAATDVSYALKTPPGFTVPAGASTANAATTFSWTRPMDAVSVVRWRVGKTVIERFTSASDAAVPKIPEAPLSADNAVWAVDVYGPMSSVDEIAGPAGRSLDSAPVRYHATTDGSRTFVWAP